ncbi:hypothetical protein FSARC_11730 [Fusarium sarcochroum]|uniref:FAD/NAD(P)-binding domain-containing protein n=1 Tax=Fusarium sarcochroum TaxID=1208366 RepID=A0A8H4TD94_9HYPO|nr:hypothetical protein FSARC_11730 [Fusarium sarcochroum]
MTTGIEKSDSPAVYPPAGDLRKLFDERPIPVISKETIDQISFTAKNESEQASIVVSSFNAALSTNNAAALQACFFTEQAYWKDALAFTSHLRTFFTPSTIATNLFATNEARGFTQEWRLEGAIFIPATPVLQFIDVSLSFRTASPAATCSGRFLLLPVKTSSGTLEWKIWILSTKLENLDIHPENESLLRLPGRNLDGVEEIETDVFIIGGGNSAAALAARLKTLGVNSVMAERNAHVGDNWALRYDCMKFHVPTSFCELPYMDYEQRFQGTYLLGKDDLADQLRRFVAAFNLNVITSAKIQSTVYDKSTGRWTIKFQTPNGLRTATAKQLVQATGIASQKPYVPTIADEQLYKGISIHSTTYKNGRQLADQGVKSVLIIGSANTGFDILGDCHAAGLETTMVVRSPTYIVPLEYVCNEISLGAYNLGVAAADRMFLTLPAVVDGQLARNLFRMLASQEPDRYAALKAVGFPVLDSAEPNQSLYSNLIEKAGGHYVDAGVTDLLAQGKAAFKAGVEPVAFTETGLHFSDGSTADADAVIWCTGFADRDTRDVVAEVLGGESSTTNGVSDCDKNLLGPREIAASIDATWGIDAEGEIRGMWKRHLRLGNYWVMGGYTQQHRWHSRTLALQIKAALEGVLPPAYRETRTVNWKYGS